MSREFKSFYKTVGGGEGQKCKYPTRLDTYGCGCQHDRSYCYAKSLLYFRKQWNAKDPAVANIQEIRKVIDQIKSGTIIRLGGMTDCFQPLEKEVRNTYRTIQMLNEKKIGYLIVTKSAMIADSEYLEILDKELAHIQITVTTLDDEFYLKRKYEKASLPSERIAAILKLQQLGFDVAIRLSPLIEEFMNFDLLNSLGIQKAIVEFLRINSWISKWLKIDESRYTHYEGGYKHLPLQEKARIMEKIRIPEVSVCEDVEKHYLYLRKRFNPDQNDCCNLRKTFRQESE